MSPQDLRVGQVWIDPDGRRVTVIHVAVSGCGDSVAWRAPDGTEARGSAAEFVASGVLVTARAE